MIYKFDYTGPGKTPRTAEIRVSSDDPRSLGTLAEDAYQAKYGSYPSFDSYAAYVKEASGLGDPGTDADGGAKGPEPDEETNFYDGDESPTLYHYDQGDEVTNPDHYNQGKIDVIEGLYQMLPFEQFRGFMKGNIIKYTVRYEHKGHGKDLDKVEEYKRRLKEYERKEKML